ncbi:MAG: hypothetical protein E7556_01440 [Ruminococcaceae bacterium]|nr:hypothetical protein [Oscillospiraceae bacterium]
MNNEYTRIRDVTHAFRTTRDEANTIDLLVKASGLTKQEYLYKKAINKDIKIICTPRVNNLLRKEIKSLIDEFSKIVEVDLSESLLNRVENILSVYYEIENKVNEKVVRE